MECTPIKAIFIAVRLLSQFALIVSLLPTISLLLLNTLFALLDK